MISFPKPPKKKHSRHISNPKPTYEDYCEFDEDGAVCGQPYAETHEIWGGKAYRNTSIKFKMQMKLCRKHHNYVQDSPKATKYREELNRRYQRIFEERNPGLCFVKVFGQDYIRGKL